MADDSDAFLRFKIQVSLRVGALVFLNLSFSKIFRIFSHGNFNYFTFSYGDAEFNVETTIDISKVDTGFKIIL